MDPEAARPDRTDMERRWPRVLPTVDALRSCPHRFSRGVFRTGPHVQEKPNKREKPDTRR